MLLCEGGILTVTVLHAHQRYSQLERPSLLEGLTSTPALYGLAIVTTLASFVGNALGAKKILAAAKCVGKAGRNTVAVLHSKVSGHTDIEM